MSHLCRSLGKLAGSSPLLSSSSRAVTASLRLSQGEFRLPVQYLKAQQCAFISTSKKDRDTTTADHSSTTTEKDEVDPSNVTGKKTKYWRTLGYNWYDEKQDQMDHNRVMFFTVTIGIVLLSFVLAYFPDVHHKDWSQREAYIEIARREALGLPHIDPNLVPPEKVNLPSEEELEDFEIII